MPAGNSNPPDTAFERELYAYLTHTDDLPAWENGFRDGARWALTSTLVRQMAEALEIYRAMLGEGNAGVAYKALEAYRQACEGKT